MTARGGVTFMQIANSANSKLQIASESTTTRKAGGLDFPALMGGERQKHVCAL